MTGEILWKVVVSVADDHAMTVRPEAVRSYNERGLPSGRDLVTIAYGKNIADIRGIIREKISYWSIDESGSVGRTGQSLGKAITYSAVTQLADVDYEKLFKDIPKVSDKRGHDEIHYMDLRMNDREKLSELVDRVADSPFLMISLPEMKLKPDLRRRWVKPKNAFYVFTAIQRLVQAIAEIDWSEMIVVTFDHTFDIGDELLEVLWSDRLIVQMHESYLCELFQISDLAASVTGNAINYPEDYDMNLFWKFYAKSINTSAHGLVTTAPSDGKTDNITRSQNYKNKSQKRLPVHGLATTAPSDGGIDKKARNRRHKTPSGRGFLGRLLR